MFVTISQQIAKAVIDLTAHDLLKQKFPSRPSERMHMVGIIKVNFATIHALSAETRNFIRDPYRDFFCDQIFSRPITRLFFETKCFRDRYRDFS